MKFLILSLRKLELLLKSKRLIGRIFLCTIFVKDGRNLSKQLIKNCGTFILALNNDCFSFSLLVAFFLFLLWLVVL